jgi:hypothetical protein
MAPRFWLTVALFIAAAGAAATLHAEDDAARKAEQQKAEAEAKAKMKADAEAKQKAEAAKRAEAAQARQAMQVELQKVFVTDLDPASDGPQPEGDPKAIQVWQRKQQIRQHAGNLQAQIQPLLRGELELIRQTCGGLDAAARRRVLSSGTVALAKAALDAANAQFGRGGHQVVTGQVMSKSLATALEKEASAEEFAAYRAEQQQRSARRRQVARRVLVADIDRVLDLSAEQRSAIDAALESQWQEGWPTSSSVVADNQIAPDFAEGCILPSLSPRQRETWRSWCEHRGWKKMVAQNPHFAGAMQFQRNHLGHVVMQADAWWGD